MKANWFQELESSRKHNKKVVIPAYNKVCPSMYEAGIQRQHLVGSDDISRESFSVIPACLPITY